MKKIITLLLCAVLFTVGLFTLSSCNLIDVDNSKEKYTYELSTEGFNETVVFGEDVNLSGLSIVKKGKDGSTVASIPVNKSMISCDTSSVGTKALLISYENEAFTVEIHVKYKVEFKDGDDIISAQYVFGSADIILPEVSSTETHEFSGWSESIPDVMSGNMLFEALYQPYIPDLPSLSAEYGSTLESLTLPSNINGEWVFALDKSTSVGAVGKRGFDVNFVSSADGTVIKSDKVYVTVTKKTVSFTEIFADFTYDGQRHTPDIIIDANVSSDNIFFIEEGTYNYTDAGEYEYLIIVEDDYHYGELSGSYCIKKLPVTVIIESVTITATEAVPTIGYTVSLPEGISVDDALLSLTIVVDEIKGAGAYGITAVTSNPNVELTVNEGTLTVEPARLDEETVGKPVLEYPEGGVYYGDSLSSITFGYNASGIWSWKDASNGVTVGDAGTNTHLAVFTHNNSSYEPLLVEVDVTVKPITLYFTVSNTRFTYDGQYHGVSYTLTDKNGNDFTSLVRVVGSETYKNAGSYGVTLSLDEQNYSATYTTTLVISKATPSASFSTVITATWKEGLTLSSLPELPTGYSWVSPSTKITSSGESQYDAIFTPTDTDNYLSVTGKIKVNVEKAAGTISGVKESYGFDYTGTAHTLTGIEATPDNVTLEYTYSKDGKTVSSMTEAGTYTVTITLPESTNYTSATATATVTINKIDNSDSVKTAYTATYGDLLYSLELPESTTGTWNFENANETTTVGEVGVNTFRIIFTPSSENYNAREEAITVTVERKSLNVSDVGYTSSRVYDGEKHTASVAYSPLYTVSDAGGTDVGTYTATLTLTDSKNYKWSTTDEASVDITYTVTVATNEWTSAPSVANPQTYGSITAAAAEAKFGGVKIEYKKQGALDSTYGTDVPDSAGDYTVRFTTTSANATTLTATLDFTINKETVEIPTGYTNSFIYDGKEHYPTLTDGTLYTVKNIQKGTDVGEYSITLTLKDSTNYQWEGQTGATVTLKYSITKATVTVSTPVIENSTYPSVGTPAATASLGTVVYLYSSSEDGEYTETAPTTAGTWYVKAVVYKTNNYDYAESSAARFEVARAAAAINGVSSTYTTTYTGNPYTLTGISSSSGGEITYAYAQNGIAVSEMKNAGEYTVTITLAGTENYLGAEATAAVTIRQIENADEIPAYTAIYGDKLESLPLPANTDGTGTWAWADASAAVGNAGSNSHTLVFTPHDTVNYASRTVNVTVTVSKKTVNVPNGPTLPYAEDTRQYSGLADNDVYTVADEGGINAGEYIAILTLKDSANYLWAGTAGESVTVTYRISEAANSWKNGVEPSIDSEWSYGEIREVAAEATSCDSISIKYKLSSSADSAYSDYTADEPIEVGSYVIYILVTAENYDDLEYYLYFTVTPKKVDIPTLNKSEFVYTGETFASGITSTDEYTVDDDGLINVGECEVKITLNDTKNYVWSDNTTGDITYTYKVAAADISLTVTDAPSWTYGEEASEPTVSITESVITEYVFDIDFVYFDGDGNALDSVPSQAGSYTVKAYYAGSADGNVNECSSEAVSFTITKAAAAINGVSSAYTTTYTGNPYTLTGISSSSGGEITYAYAQNGIAVSAMKNAGEYTVTITLAETANYLGAEATAAVTIRQIENADEIPAYTAIYGDKLESLPLPANTDGTGTWAWADASATVGNAGSNIHTLVFTPDDSVNYAEREVEVNVTVSRKPVDVPALSENEFTYTGETFTSGITETVYYTVSDAGATNAGDRCTVTVTLNDGNYIWADGVESLSRTFTYEVVPASITLTIANAPSWTYGDEAGEPTVSITESIAIEYDFYISFVYYDGDGNELDSVPTVAGGYKVKAVYRGDANVNGCESSAVQFSISQQEVTPPNAPSNLPYNGKRQYANITVGTDSLYSVTDGGGIDIGTYTATVSLNDTLNYCWSDTGNSAAKNFEYAITYAAAEITNFVVSGWTYNEGAVAPTASTNLGTVVFTYYDEDGNKLDAAPSAAGTYYVTASVAETDNYSGYETGKKALVIEKAEATVSGYLDTTREYYENTIAIDYTAANNGSITATHMNASVPGTFSYTDLTYVHGTGNSSVILTFTPTDTSNYATVECKLSITLKTVADLHSTVDGSTVITHYGTIENALYDASTNDTVWVLPDKTGNLCITKDTEVKAGVTLLLPYGTYEEETASAASARNQSSEATLNTKTLAGDTYCLTKVTVANGVTVTNRGTIEISGILSGGGGAKAYSGQTASSHAKLLLGNGAKIVSESGSSILCYGYIYETSTSNGSEIIINSGASIYMPFILRDHRGGTYMYSVYNDMGDTYASPFSRFMFANVSPLLTVNYNGTLYGWANLYAGNQQNATTVTMIGTSNAAVIQMSSESYSYATAKFEPVSQVCELTLIGGAAINSLSITFTPNESIGKITVNTEDCFFPLTYHFNITLDRAETQTEDAVFTLNQKLKLMPGCVLTIEEGAVANVDTVIVYESFTDTHGNCAYPSADIADLDGDGDCSETIPPARLTVNGRLVCNVLGGKVYTDDISRVTVNSTGYCTSYEPKTALVVGISYSVVEYHVISAPAVLCASDGTSYVWSGQWYKTESATPYLHLTDDGYTYHTLSILGVSTNVTDSEMTSHSITYSFTVSSDGTATVTISFYVKYDVGSSSATISVDGADCTVSKTTSGVITKKYYCETTVTVTDNTAITVTLVSG